MSLEEVDVLGEVEGVLTAVTYHVGVQDVVGTLEDLGEVHLVRGSLQWKLQYPHQQVDDLECLLSVDDEGGCGKWSEKVEKG